MPSVAGTVCECEGKWYSMDEVSFGMDEVIMEKSEL